MELKRLIVNSHYSKRVSHPQDCFLRKTEPGDVYGDNYYCGVIHDICCGFDKFPGDCPLDDWEGTRNDIEEQSPVKYKCTYPGACGMLLKSCWKNRPDCEYRIYEKEAL